MTDPLSLTLRLSPDATDNRVGDETVILHLGNDTYFGLDPVGTVIWEGLKQGRSLPEIRNAILHDFDAPAERVEEDMRRFLTDLLAHDILLAK